MGLMLLILRSRWDTKSQHFWNLPFLGLESPMRDPYVQVVGALRSKGCRGSSDGLWSRKEVLVAESL